MDRPFSERGKKDCARLGARLRSESETVMQRIDNEEAVEGIAIVPSETGEVSQPNGVVEDIDVPIQRLRAHNGSEDRVPLEEPTSLRVIHARANTRARSDQPARP